MPPAAAPDTCRCETAPCGGGGDRAGPGGRRTAVGSWLLQSAVLPSRCPCWSCCCCHCCCCCCCHWAEAWPPDMNDMADPTRGTPLGRCGGGGSSCDCMRDSCLDGSRASTASCCFCRRASSSCPSAQNGTPPIAPGLSDMALGTPPYRRPPYEKPYGEPAAEAGLNRPPIEDGARGGSGGGGGDWPRKDARDGARGGSGSGGGARGAAAAGSGGGGGGGSASSLAE